MHCGCDERMLADTFEDVSPLMANFRVQGSRFENDDCVAGKPGTVITGAKLQLEKEGGPAETARRNVLR